MRIIILYYIPMLKVQYWLASIPGRVFAFITVRQTTILTVIKAKTRPGIEARLSLDPRPSFCFYNG